MTYRMAGISSLGWTNVGEDGDSTTDSTASRGLFWPKDEQFVEDQPEAEEGYATKWEVSLP